MPPTLTTHHRDTLGPYALLTVGAITQRFRYCPPGSFRMGSPEDEPGRWPDEGPQHIVCLTTGFYLADTPVTQALWTATGRRNPSRFVHDYHPVEQVTYHEAAAFCAELSCQLPTEAQWEYACRAGTQSALYNGPIDILGEHNAPALDPIAWYGGNSGVGFVHPNPRASHHWPEKQHPHTRAGTRPVATRAPNPWGLYDMLGNVYEWCRDRPRAYTAAPVDDPCEDEGAERVIRGGAYSSRARGVRAANRLQHPIHDGRNYIGLRLLFAPRDAPAQPP